MIQKLLYHRLLPAFFVMFAISACSRYGDDVTTSETDTIFTIRDKETNFSGLTKTYAIVDKINLVQDPDNAIDSVQFWARYNEPVLNAINTNLANLGYTEVPNSQNPALFINVTANANVTTGAYSPGWWWGYYPCYPYYSWWCGGGYYPGSVYVYSFTEGSLAIEMIDIKRSMENEKATIIWFSGMTFVVSENPTDNVNRAVKDINQAFDQSPYLR